MTENVLVPVMASLSNPNDPIELTMIADVSSVGVTKETASGYKVNWTPELLRAKAKSLVDKPVNVYLEENDPINGKPTGHTKEVIGTIGDADYDETLGKITARAVLWKHYYPETIRRLGELYASGGLQVSAEFDPFSYENEDGNVRRMTDGVFSGLAIVNEGADLGNRVRLFAAYKKDTEANMTQPNAEILPHSYEWLGDKISEYLASKLTKEDDKAVVNGTFPDSFRFTANDKRYSVNFEYTGDELKFSDPVEVDPSDEVNLSIFTVKKESAEPTISGELNMPTEAEFAELEAAKETAVSSAAEWESKFNALFAQVEAEKAAKAADELATTRLAEIETIAPYQDASLKEEHRALFAVADEKVFDAFKKMVTASAAPKKGIAGGEPIDDGEEDLDPVMAQAKKELPSWREEALAYAASLQPATN